MALNLPFCTCSFVQVDHPFQFFLPFCHFPLTRARLCFAWTFKAAGLELQRAANVSHTAPLYKFCHRYFIHNVCQRFLTRVDSVCSEETQPSENPVDKKKLSNTNCSCCTLVGIYWEAERCRYCMESSRKTENPEAKGQHVLNIIISGVFFVAVFCSWSLPACLGFSTAWSPVWCVVAYRKERKSEANHKRGNERRQD